MTPRAITDVRYDFTGKVVVITGGARGQGAVHARHFAAAGATVAICDVGLDAVPTLPYGTATTDDLNAVAQSIQAQGGVCLAAVCDVRESAQVAEFVADVIATYGRIDVLISNAGVESLFFIQDMPEEAWDVMLDTNLKGGFLMAKAVVPHMIEGGGGSIVFTGSVSSISGTPMQTHYAASKHGIVGLAKALATEVAEHGIRVNVVCPGGVDTPMVAGLAATAQGERWFSLLGPLIGAANLFDAGGAMLDPEEVTHAMMWLASDASQFITGASIMVDAGNSIK
jgi:NAD(P)-dependent dehydrogenase (short-subunit alcohol dehydrogenase family)